MRMFHISRFIRNCSSSHVGSPKQPLVGQKRQCVPGRCTQAKEVTVQSRACPWFSLVRQLKFRGVSQQGQMTQSFFSCIFF